MTKNTIKQSNYSDELQKYLHKALGDHAIRAVGIDGYAEDPVSFELYESDKLAGSIVCQMVWGQLHIKLLFVEENHRNKGYARNLINQAIAYGKKRNCKFAFVETFNFQAPDFYVKMGFEIELIRKGYDHETKFFYLRRDL